MGKYLCDVVKYLLGMVMKRRGMYLRLCVLVCAIGLCLWGDEVVKWALLCLFVSYVAFEWGLTTSLTTFLKVYADQDREKYEGKTEVLFDLDGVREIDFGETVREKVVEVQLLINQRFIDDMYGGEVPEDTIRRIIHKVHGEFFPDSYSDVDIDEMEM